MIRERRGQAEGSARRREGRTAWRTEMGAAPNLRRPDTVRRVTVPVAWFGGDVSLHQKAS